LKEFHDTIKISNGQAFAQLGSKLDPRARVPKPEIVILAVQDIDLGLLGLRDPAVEHQHETVQYPPVVAFDNGSLIQHHSILGSIQGIGVVQQ